MSELNDPRVLFAAERTLLAWSRTSLTLMAFGFVIERFDLYLRFVGTIPLQIGREFSLWISLTLIIFGGMLALLSAVQYKRVVRTLKPVEIPEGYWVNAPVALSWTLTFLSLLLIGYVLYFV